jgi:hypothetical protein
MRLLPLEHCGATDGYCATCAYLLIDEATSNSDAFWNCASGDDCADGSGSQCGVVLEIPDYVSQNSTSYAAGEYCFNIKGSNGYCPTPQAYDFAEFNLTDPSAPDSILKEVDGTIIPNDGGWPFNALGATPGDGWTLNRTVVDVDDPPASKSDLSSVADDGAKFLECTGSCAECTTNAPPRISISIKSAEALTDQVISHIFELDDPSDPDKDCDRDPKAGKPSVELNSQQQAPVITATITQLNTQDLTSAPYNQYRLRFLGLALLYRSASDTNPENISPSVFPDYHNITNLVRAGVVGSTYPADQHVLSNMPSTEGTVYNKPNDGVHENVSIQLDLSGHNAKGNEDKTVFVDPTKGQLKTMSATAYIKYGLWARVEIPNLCKDLKTNGGVEDDGWEDAVYFGDAVADDGIPTNDATGMGKMCRIKGETFNLDAAIGCDFSKNVASGAKATAQTGSFTFPDTLGAQTSGSTNHSSPAAKGPVNFYAQDGTHDSITWKFGVQNNGIGSVKAMMTAWELEVKPEGDDEYKDSDLVTPSDIVTIPASVRTWFGNGTKPMIMGMLQNFGASKQALTEECKIDIKKLISLEAFERGDWRLTMVFKLANFGPLLAKAAPSEENHFTNAKLSLSWSMPSTIFIAKHQIMQGE